MVVPQEQNAVADRPDAVVVAGRSLSDEALDAASSALAADLVGAPVVAVDAAPSLETVVAVVAALRAGVPVVPLPPDAGPAELGHVLADSGAALLLAGGDRRAVVAEMVGAADRGGIPVREVDLAARGGSPPPPPALLAPGGPDPSASGGGSGRSASGGGSGRSASGGGSGRSAPGVAPDEPPAVVLYTSGTTGPPKGVATTAAAIAFDLDALADAWAWTADDTVVHGLPLFHVHGLILGILGPLRRGGRVVHTGRPTPEGYAEAVARRGGTLCFGVPTVWGRVAQSAAAGGLRGARLLVSGSAPLPVPVFDAVAARAGHRLVERYGMTETLITLSARADGPRRAGSVGGPLPGLAARVVDDDGAPVPADGETIGGLQVRGPTLMAGYLGRPAETAACLTPDGWFLTGDVAVVGPDDQHRIVGRSSTDLIKTGGFRVGAGEVEAALLAHPAVREAAVVGEPDADLGQVVVAYVVADGDAGDLGAWVGGRLAAHKRPRRVVPVEALPRNALGKVQKARLTGGR